MQNLKDLILEHLQNILNNEFFIVDIQLNEKNDTIRIFLDKYNGAISLNECEHIHKQLLPVLDEVMDNFELEVSSPGLTAPFKVWQQYYKNINEKVNIITADNQQFRAQILDADDKLVELKNLKTNEVDSYKYSQIKKATLILDF